VDLDLIGRSTDDAHEIRAPVAVHVAERDAGRGRREGRRHAGPRSSAGRPRRSGRARRSRCNRRRRAGKLSGTPSSSQSGVARVARWRRSWTTPPAGARDDEVTPPVTVHVRSGEVDRRRPDLERHRRLERAVAAVAREHHAVALGARGGDVAPAVAVEVDQQNARRAFDRHRREDGPGHHGDVA
jgi:hypothetical protein